MIRTMLTTVDNPFDPFTQFDEWQKFDERQGYYSMNYLARLAVTSSELSDADQEQAIADAIEQIVEENLSGMHRKVTKEFDDISGLPV